MNILDFKEKECNGSVLKAIFDETKRLNSRYQEFVTDLKGLKIPINIDTFEGQKVMKHFLETCVVEELMEMREAIVEGDRIEHVYEEVGDSLNFLMTAYVIYGWDEKKFKTLEEIYGNRIDVDIKDVKNLSLKYIDKCLIDIIYQLGITCNKLKIRPWKKSQYLTDVIVFEERFEKLFYDFFSLIFDPLYITPTQLWSIFSRKNQCNQFRINTGY